MQRKLLFIFLVTFFLVFFSPSRIVQAHEAITAGPYTLEYGWLSEPPIVGQSNAIVINISQGEASQNAGSIDSSALRIEMVYGDQSKFLTLQPLGEDTPGQYIAPILPSVAGTYTLRLSGTLGSTPVQAEVQPEEVRPADFIQFPSLSAADPTSTRTDWLGLAGLVLGTAGTALGIAALLVRRDRGGIKP